MCPNWGRGQKFLRPYGIIEEFGFSFEPGKLFSVSYLGGCCSCFVSLAFFPWLVFCVCVFVLWWIELGQACFSSIHICLVLCLYTKFNLRFELLSPWIPLWSVSMLDYALCCPQEYKPVTSTFLVTAPAHLLQIVFLVWGLAVNSLYICILCQSKDTIEELISKNISIQNRAIVDGFSKNIA